MKLLQVICVLLNILLLASCTRADKGYTKAEIVSVHQERCENNSNNKKGITISFAPRLYKVELRYKYKVEGKEYKGSKTFTGCLAENKAEKIEKALEASFPNGSEVGISYSKSMPIFSNFRNEWIELDGIYTSMATMAGTHYDAYNKVIKLGKIGYEYNIDKQTFLEQTENHPFQIPFDNPSEEQVESFRQKFKSEVQENKKVIVYANAIDPSISALIKPYGAITKKMTAAEANSNPCPWPSFKKVPYIAKRGVLQRQIETPDYYSVPKHYLTTTGHVSKYLPCDLSSHQEFPDCCKVYVEYTYNINGKTYENHLIGVGNYSSPENLEKFKQMYPENNLTVYYDPNDPSIASI